MVICNEYKYEIYTKRGECDVLVMKPVFSVVKDKNNNNNTELIIFEDFIILS